MNNYQCRICNSTQIQQFMFVREMMFGFRDEFFYFKCSTCGCLQIAEIPNDLSKYYSKSYYSFKQVTSSKFKNLIQYFLANAYSKGLTFLKNWPYLRNINRTVLLETLKKFTKEAYLLDIGCGNGTLLKEIRSWGYSNLTGIDPFIETDILYSYGVKIQKQTLKEHVIKLQNNFRYDLVMLNHSLEHIYDQHEIFKSVYKILNNNSIMLIRVPVCDSYAFRKYQNNWWQIDAPRHFYLHTTKSICNLAKSHGFVVENIICDSHESQIINSEKYCKDITLLEKMQNTSLNIKKLKKYVKHLNDIKDGDQCIFILKKE